MDDRIEQQRAIYGTTLAERFESVMQSYGICLDSLARVLGVSSSMLSELMSGQRIKIGDPSVYGRLQMLEDRADQGDRENVLREVAQADPLGAPPLDEDSEQESDREVVVEYLRDIANRDGLQALAAQAKELESSSLAQLLGQAAEIIE